MVQPYLKEKIESRAAGLTVGTHIEMSDTISSDIIGRVGYDFALLDADTSENCYASLRNHMVSLNSARTPVVVRAASNIHSHISRILEYGPDGIIFPAINTAEEAENAISQCLYPPEGRRRYSPLRAVGYGLDDAMLNVRSDSYKMCRFIQIDSAEAIRNLPDIVSNPKIDGYFFSPGELQRRDGSPDGFYGPETPALLREAAELIKDAGKPIGVSVFTAGADALRFWLSLGASIIVSGTDFGYILSGASENLRNIRKITD